MIPHVIPPVKPFTFLCTEIWPSVKSITRIPSTTPVLFLSGRKDELVPPAHMDKLYALCKSERKVWKSIQDGTHSEWKKNNVRNDSKTFLNQIVMNISFEFQLFSFQTTLASNRATLKLFLHSFYLT